MPIIPVFKVYMDPETQGVLNKTLYSGFIGEGHVVKEFERRLASTFKVDRVLALNSATSGLELACYVIANSRTWSGDKFLTTALTCTATNWPILRHGFEPVWVDVDPLTLNMDLDDLRRKLQVFGSSIAGIMLTHWAGRSHNMDAVLQIKEEYESRHGQPLAIVEDCAHAYGGSYKGQPLGTFGDFGVYSFQAVKPLTTGDGGCLIARSQEDYERIKLLRWYGIDRDDREADIVEPGFKYHMNDISASIGLANIDAALENTKANARNAAHYEKALRGIDGLSPLAWPDADTCHPYWIYTILVEHRDDFHLAMKSRGIETSIVHKRNDAYKCTKAFGEKLPNLDAVCGKITHIPAGWWLTDEDRDYIVSAIQEGW